MHAPFSPMRSTGSGLGVEGVFARRCVRVRNCSQQFATARNVRKRRQPSVRTPHGGPYGKFCRGCHFWKFQKCRWFVSGGGRVTLSVCVAGAILVAHFQKIFCIFVAGAALWTCPVAYFQVLSKTRRKRVKSEEVSYELLVLVPAPVSSGTSGFSVASRCLWGKLQKLSFLSCCQLWKLPEVSHKMLVFLHPRVLSRVACFSVASPCCVAGVAPCDIPTCLLLRLFYRYTLLHADTFIHKHLDTKTLLHNKIFDMQTLSHTKKITHKFFYRQVLS